MCVAFAGYKIIHIYERWAWIPVLFALLVTVGYAGGDLKKQAVVAPPKAPVVINMISLMAGYMISWGNVVGDYCVYMPPNAPKIRLFSYCLFGICTPIIVLLTLGAAIGGSILSNPTWLHAYKLNSTGGVLGAILSPAGGFGKFILVILAFSVIGTCSREIYTVSVDFQVLIPKAHLIPRLFWVIITSSLIIGIAIGAVQSFYEALQSFLYFIGYWSASYVSIILLEFLYFRKGDPLTYDHSIWDSASKLPPGIAASAAVLLPWAAVVPSMDETWYTGPIAKITGDLGFEFAGLLSILLYIPFRTLEIKLRKGRL
jgi:purine-cytosine permease-like protein